MKAEHEEKISNNTKTVFDNAETDIINRMDLVKWINGLEKNMMDISLFLDETLGEKNPEIRRLKYRDFSKKLSDLCTDFYIEVETYSRIAKKEFGVDGIERELRVVISYFSDEIRKLGDYYLHEANTNDALDGNNNICNIMHRKISLIRNKII